MLRPILDQPVGDHLWAMIEVTYAVFAVEVTDPQVAAEGGPCLGGQERLGDRDLAVQRRFGLNRRCGRVGLASERAGDHDGGCCQPQYGGGCDGPCEVFYWFIGEPLVAAVQFKLEFHVYGRHVCGDAT